MKLFSIILSFIVFSQSVYLDCAMPLFDNANDDSVECCSHSEPQNDKDHEEDNHNCSPFCTDDCCSSTVYISYQIYIDSIPSENETAYFSHLNNYTYYFGIKLYHPPRV